VVNAYAEWHPEANENLRVRLGVDNLFDATYYERSSYISRALGARDVQPLLAPGRTVTLGVSMEF
jgi:hemoglobin/transferrin/lactoferrin receptor protein